MVDFLTQEWADELAACLNRNPNYKKSAKTWEGALILEFKAENARLEKDAYLLLDLWHGECRGARFLDEGEEAEHEFTISAKETDWHDLVTGKQDPSKALMTGKYKVKGNLGKLMRFPKAAAYVLKYLKRLLEDW